MQDLQHFQTQCKPSCPPRSVLSTEKGYKGGDGGGGGKKKKIKITARKQTYASMSQQQRLQAGKLPGKARQQQAPAVGEGQWNGECCPRLPTSVHVKGPASAGAVSSWVRKSWSMLCFCQAKPARQAEQGSVPAAG